jgi:hypothetical protein
MGSRAASGKLEKHVDASPSSLSSPAVTCNKQKERT